MSLLIGVVLKQLGQINIWETIFIDTMTGIYKLTYFVLDI